MSSDSQRRLEQEAESQPVTGWQRSMVLAVDRFVYWLARHWGVVLTGIAALYVGLPFLAPILMNAGVTTPARAIYRIYSPMCHQMASRSFFLFGEQPAYPRALAGTDLTPIENYMPELEAFQTISPDPAAWPEFLIPARNFIGNAEMGYKVALCERDIGIYAFVLLGSILYLLLRRRIKIPPLPFWAFILIGLGPIALDGFSQLLSMYGAASDSLSFLNTIFPLRESTPFLRTTTGALFGLSLVWLTFPHIDRGMQQTEADVGAKLRRADVIS